MMPNPKRIVFIDLESSINESSNFEEFAQCFVIHSIGTVEHDTLFSYCFGQIFGCFRLQLKIALSLDR